MTKAYVEIRSQSPRGTWPKQGPDTYVAVQVVPDGQQRLRVLNHKVAAKRGIEIIVVGDGYSEHRGPTSFLGQAIAEAEELAASINSKVESNV